MTQFASTLYPQTNPSNQILLNARYAHRQGHSFRKLLAILDSQVNYSGDFVTRDWERITNPSQITHARRVLSRLAALSG